jgi:hypothetical protein
MMTEQPVARCGFTADTGTEGSNPSSSSEESANYRFSRVGIDASARAFPRSRLPNCG